MRRLFQDKIIQSLLRHSSLAVTMAYYVKALPPANVKGDAKAKCSGAEESMIDRMIDPQIIDPEQILTVEELMARLKVTKRFIYEKCRSAVAIPCPFFVRAAGICVFIGPMFRGR